MKQLLIGIMIPFVDTALGSAMVFIMKDKINEKLEKVLLGFASGVMVAAAVAVLLTGITKSVLPYMLAFAAGAMFYVVIEDLIPDMQGEKHSNLPSLGFTVGFVIMMILDVALG